MADQIPITDEEYTRLSLLLSASMLRDYIGTEILGYGIREWGRKIEKDHTTVSQNAKNARRRLDRIAEEASVDGATGEEP